MSTLDYNTPTSTAEQSPGSFSLQQPSRAGKVPKPVMEKRRRARINKCLEELKVLVPDLTESGTRVDKADVLEMTVEHLTRMRNKRRNLTSNLSTHPTPYVNPHVQFSQGYQQCMSEVTKLLMSSPVDEDVAQKLVEHLTNRNAVLNTPTTPRVPSSTPLVASTGPLMRSHCSPSPPLRNTSPVINFQQTSTRPEPIRSNLQIPQFNFSPMHYAKQLPKYHSPEPHYPSPPNSPVDTSSSPDTTISMLPSVARRPIRPIPQVWRPW